jgi:hypothetical protein
LREKGPGFRETPNIVTPGTVRAHAHPTGNERSWATSCANVLVRHYPTYPAVETRKRGEKKTNRTYGDAGVSKMEKLIETGYEYGPEEPNRPRAKGIDRHFHVVRVGDGCPYFGIRRFVLPL